MLYLAIGLALLIPVALPSMVLSSLTFNGYLGMVLMMNSPSTVKLESFLINVDSYSHWNY